MNLANQARNERLKTDRRIRALQKMAKGKDFSKGERAQFKDEIKQLRQAANATRQYTKSGRKIKSRTAEQRQAAVDTLRELNRRYDTFIERRSANSSERNIYIKQQMRLAKSGESGSIYSEKEMSIFFMVTKNIWNAEGVDITKRLEAVSKAFREPDYEKLIANVLRAYVGQYSKYMGISLEEMTEELLDELMDALEPKKGSPPYFGQVTLSYYNEILDTFQKQ